MSLSLVHGSLSSRSAQRVKLPLLLLFASKPGRVGAIEKRRSRCRRHFSIVPTRPSVGTGKRQLRRRRQRLPSPERDRGESERGKRKSWQWKLSLSPLRGRGHGSMPLSTLLTQPLGSDLDSLSILRPKAITLVRSLIQRHSLCLRLLDLVGRRLKGQAYAVVRSPRMRATNVDKLST